MNKIKLSLIKYDKPIKRENDVLLITGDGKTLPDDLDRFYAAGAPHDTMFIGRSIKLVKANPLHYADVDADEGKWVAENLHHTYPQKINGKLIKHTIGDVPWFDVAWDIEEEPVFGDEICWYGSTALFAVLAGLETGYSKIVLAGCPMDSKGHWYFDSQEYGPTWKAGDYQAWLEFAAQPEAQKVKSMSGYTKTILGEF